LINAVANGSVIALARDATRRRRDADARGAATRARGRTGRGADDTKQPSSPATSPVPAPQAAAAQRPSRETVRASLALVPPVRWRRASLDDVISAEFVSEKLLA